MKGPIPQCLLTRQIKSEPAESFSQSYSDGNEIIFAFSLPMKGSLFCDCMVKQGRIHSGYQPYNMMGIEDLLSWRTPSIPLETFLVALDATGLDDTSYQVVKLTDLIDAMKAGRKEIEYIEYRPGSENGSERYSE